MRRFISIGLAAIIITAAPFIISCNDNNSNESELPADAPEITGESNGEAYVDLSVGIIERAETYKWLRNGTEVQNNNSRTYRATESGIYTVAGVNTRGEGKASAEKSVTISIELPADAPEIQGNDTGEDFVELSVAAIKRAVSYRWFKDGAEVQDTDSKTYRATESGTYTVAGVNTYGQGKASPAKVITIEEANSDITIDELVGTWSVSGYYLQFSSDTHYYITHKAQISKIDDETLLFYDYLGLNALFHPIGGRIDDAVMKFDAQKGRLTIIDTKSTFFDFNLTNAETNVQLITPAIHTEQFTDNLDEDFPRYKVVKNYEGYSISFEDPRSGYVFDVGGQNYYGNCLMMDFIKDASITAENWTGVYGVYYGTQYKKGGL